MYWMLRFLIASNVAVAALAYMLRLCLRRLLKLQRATGTVTRDEATLEHFATTCFYVIPFVVGATVVISLQVTHAFKGVFGYGFFWSALNAIMAIPVLYYAVLTIADAVNETKNGTAHGADSSSDQH